MSNYADWDTKAQSETAGYAPPKYEAPPYQWGEPSPVPKYEAPAMPTLPATIQITENAPVDPMENEDMFRAFMTKLANKVVEASGLAAKVAELEGKVSALQSEAGMWEQKHREEVTAHEGTKANLATTTRALNDEQSYNKMQAEENDRTVADLRTAREDRDHAVGAARDWERQYIAAAQAKDHAELEAATLREQVTRLNAKIANMVQALQS